MTAMPDDAIAAPNPKKSLWKRLYKSPFTWLVVFGFLLTACQFPGMGEEFPGNEEVKRLSLDVHTEKRTYDVSYLIAGDPTKQRVIFVHGTPGSATGWLDYMEDVSARYEYVAIDRPGFGLSRPNKALVELDAQAAALEPFLVERDGKWPILVGHSLGGPIVAAAAANYKDRVGGIIELAGSLDPELEEIKFIQYIGETPPFVWMIPKALKHTNREIFALEDELELLREKLGDITVPVMIIHGTNDDLVPYANVPFMKKYMSNAKNLELITLEGQNHFLPWNSANILNAAINRMADDFPGGPMDEIVLDLSNQTAVTGFSPPGAIFQSEVAAKPSSH